MSKINKKKNGFVVLLIRIIWTVVGICVAAVMIILGINVFVKLKVRRHIISVDKAAKLEDVDCIMVLGASVKNGDTPSKMLADRLDKGVEVYYAMEDAKLLMSGDRTDQYYDEVKVMKNYAEDKGVPATMIDTDPEGYSTYESIYRAKYVYGVDKMVIVTQKYHLYRALYIADKLGIEAYGVAAEDIRYSGQTKRDIREIFAIDKDFFMVMLSPDVSINDTEEE